MSNQIKTKILTGWDSGSNIVFIVKKEGKTFRKQVIDTEWYFVLRTTDYEKIGGDQYLKKKLKKLFQFSKTFKTFTKIYCSDTLRNVHISEFVEFLKKKKIDVFEADLSRTKRFMVDNQLPIADDLNILYFDIETDDSNNGIEIGRDQILSWAAYDNQGNSWFECSNDEKEVLNSFLKCLDSHDVLIGWNSMKFDLPYIQARMLKHQITYNWRQHIHIDLMKRCIKLYSYEMDKIGLTGFSLNEISRVFLKEQKVEHSEKIKEMFDFNRELLEKYNRKDAELLLKLDEKLEITKLMINECVWTGTPLDRFYVGELLDNYMLRKSKLQKKYLLSRPSKEETEKNSNTHIIGGYVKSPITGVYDFVRVFDFKSLYPSIIVTWNISPDSLDLEKSKLGDQSFNKFVGSDRKIEEVGFDEWYSFLASQKKLIDPNNECFQTANNNYFRRTEDAFISSLIEELLDKRKEIKRKMVGLQPDSAEYGQARSAQWIVKELANSMYGITADSSSRYFNKNVAESITITGQFMNKTISSILKKKNNITVIYQDTDSSFCAIPGTREEIDEINKKTNSTLKKFLLQKFDISKNIMCLEYEKAFRRMIMVDKKRYTGRMMWLNEQEVDILFSKGLEDVKKNTIEITKNAMRQLVSKITVDEIISKDAHEWIIELKKHLFDEKYLPKKEEITISTRLSKPTYKYASKSVHVILAEKMIEEGKILQPSEGKDAWGTRIDYIIVQSIPKQIAIHSDEYDGQWDRRYYWDTQIYAPISRILHIVWPDEDWDIYFEYITEKRKKEEEKELRKKQIEQERTLREERKKIREEMKKQREKEREERKKIREEKKKSKKK